MLSDHRHPREKVPFTNGLECTLCLGAALSRLGTIPVPQMSSRWAGHSFESGHPHHYSQDVFSAPSSGTPIPFPSLRRSWGLAFQFMPGMTCTWPGSPHSPLCSAFPRTGPLLVSPHVQHRCVEKRGARSIPHVSGAKLVVPCPMPCGLLAPVCSWYPSLCPTSVGLGSDPVFQGSVATYLGDA